MRHKLHFLPVFIWVIIASPLHGQSDQLLRRGIWEARFEDPTKFFLGARLSEIDAGSPLAKAGFQPGDLLIGVNDKPITTPEAWTGIYTGLKGTTPTRIKVLRGTQAIEREVEFKERPRESHTGLDTYYEEVTSGHGIIHRTIITKPRLAGRQPAILVLDGLSCSSIEVYPGRTDNWGRTLTDLVENSGMVVLRIEKAGVGDSKGDCAESDFYVDLAGYEAAIKSLKAKPYVDPERIVVYGSSMGSALAPYFANRHGLAGIVSDGTFFKTWFEHMLEIERRIRQFEGDSESEITSKINLYYLPLYYGMLLERKSFGEITDQYPALTQYNYHGREHMYGRPMAYYQQLQQFDLAAEWEKVKVPVRILRGTTDWIMSAEDNHMIIDVLKRSGHADHLMYEYEGLDHWNTIHENARDSYEGKNGRWDPAMPQLLIDWARGMAGLQ